jgi:hypothetical protein
MISDIEKQAYIQRIDKKALEENLPLKLAAKKLGLKDWRYWKYKNELKGANISPASVASGPAVEIVSDRPKVVTIQVAKDVYDKLLERSERYATDPDTIAKIILHDAVRKNGEHTAN